MTTLRITPLLKLATLGLTLGLSIGPLGGLRRKENLRRRRDAFGT